MSILSTSLPTKPPKKLIHIDIDGVIANYDAMAALTTDKEERNKKGFFLSLPIINGALDAVYKLAEHYDIYFCSTAPWSNINAGSEKRIWLEHYFGELAFKRLILTHRKDLIIGDYLIDDRTKNGAGEFKGKHIHFGSPQFPDWKSVLDYLLPEDPDGLYCPFCDSKTNEECKEGCLQKNK